jgi:hypothetical protein
MTSKHSQMTRCHSQMVLYHYGMPPTIMECFIMVRPKTPFRRVASGVTGNEGRCPHTPRLRPAASVLRDDPRRESHTLAERQSLTTKTAVAARCRATPLHGDTNQQNGGPLPRSPGAGQPSLPTGAHAPPRVFQDLGHHYGMIWNIT